MGHNPQVKIRNFYMKGDFGNDPRSHFHQVVSEQGKFPARRRIPEREEEAGGTVVLKLASLWSYRLADGSNGR